MIENEETPEQYFRRNVDPWLADAYNQSGHNYPTPHHRLRIIKRITSSIGSGLHVVDLGCGGGNLAVELARLGHAVTGVDKSSEMLARAAELVQVEPEAVQQRITFREVDLHEAGETNADLVTSMGVIGYQPTDDDLFDIARPTLKDHGTFAVSFRNRLFNLYSPSHRTLRDIESGDYERLLDESKELYAALEPTTVRDVLAGLSAAAAEASDETLARAADTSTAPSTAQGVSYTSEFEARQTTPAEARAAADRGGFETVSLHGVHPHILVPGLNQLMPPTVYNRLSDGLLTFEDSPVALLWSSVFIGVFRKK